MKISKRAQGMSATTTLQSVQNLKSELAKLVPMMQNLPAQLEQVNELVANLEVQVGQLEQMKSKIQEQTQQADDSAHDRSFGEWVKDVSGKGMAKLEEWFGEESKDEPPASNSAAGVRGCDDSYSDKLNKAHESAGIPTFWRRNLDYNATKNASGQYKITWDESEFFGNTTIDIGVVELETGKVYDEKDFSGDAEEVSPKAEKYVNDLRQKYPGSPVEKNV